MPEYTGNPNSHAKSSFPDHLVGTCLCGSIRVTINDGELFTRRRGHLCHCASCRKISGSFAQSSLNIEEDKVVIEDLKGTRKSYDDTGGSGKIVRRVFCGSCGRYDYFDVFSFPFSFLIPCACCVRVSLRGITLLYQKQEKLILDPLVL
jgi:hypothetical protein